MSLIKNTSIYTLGSILPKIGAFIFLPLYLKYLTPVDYGIISSLHVLNAILLVLFTFSMPRALYRLYYDYKIIEEQKKLFGTVFISVVVLSLISVLILFLLQNQIQNIYNSINFYPYFAYAIIIVLFQSLHTIPTIFLQIKEQASTFVIISVSLFFFKSLIILLFIIALDKGALGYLQAELITALVFLPIYYYFIKNYIKLIWNRKIFINVISFCLPILPNIISAWILNLSDRIFIEHFFTAADVGIYSLGYQIAGLVLIFSIAFKKAYDPYFYKVANTEKTKKAKEKLYKTNFVFILILLLVSFILSLFAKEGVMLFFNIDYYPAIQVIPIISLAYLISQNSALLNVMMYQNKKTILVLYLTLGSAILNIILNYTLIPWIGIMGAAYATLISFFGLFISSYFIAKKTFFIPYNWKEIIPIFALLLGVYLLFTYFEIENIFLSIFLKLLVVIFLTYVFYLKNKKTILAFIRVQK